MISMPILGYMIVYNEEDIIEETLKYYINLNIPLLVIDNGSTDNTGEILKKYVNQGVVELINYPTPEHDWQYMLQYVITQVGKYNPTWVMHIDADHFYEPPDGFKSFFELIEKAQEKGCNCINFKEYIFFPTLLDNKETYSILERVRHYALRYPGLLQPRLFRYETGVDISKNGGHKVTYPDTPTILFPEFAILRHYPFRSINQGKKKLIERRSRYSIKGLARGWHHQYNNWDENNENTFLKDANKLNCRIDGDMWRDNIVFIKGKLSRWGCLHIARSKYITVKYKLKNIKF